MTTCYRIFFHNAGTVPSPAGQCGIHGRHSYTETGVLSVFFSFHLPVLFHQCFIFMYSSIAGAI